MLRTFRIRWHCFSTLPKKTYVERAAKKRRIEVELFQSSPVQESKTEPNNIPDVDMSDSQTDEQSAGDDESFTIRSVPLFPDLSPSQHQGHPETVNTHRKIDDILSEIRKMRTSMEESGKIDQGWRLPSQEELREVLVCRRIYMAMECVIPHVAWTTSNCTSSSQAPQKGEKTEAEEQWTVPISIQWLHINELSQGRDGWCWYWKWSHFRSFLYNKFLKWWRDNILGISIHGPEHQNFWWNFCPVYW